VQGALSPPAEDAFARPVADHHHVRSQHIDVYGQCIERAAACDVTVGVYAVTVQPRSGVLYAH
jgi:hypothetical protein